LAAASERAEGDPRPVSMTLDRRAFSVGLGCDMLGAGDDTAAGDCSSGAHSPLPGPSP
jgi:hypothetical protein